MTKDIYEQVKDEPHHNCAALKAHNESGLVEGEKLYEIVRLERHNQVIWRWVIGIDNYALWIDYCPFCGEKLEGGRMTRQEEIRRELYIRSLKHFKDLQDASYSGGENCPTQSLVDELLEYLHSQDAMVKVKCPDCKWSQFGIEYAYSNTAVGMTPCPSCYSTGYIFEPLIKEGG